MKSSIRFEKRNKRGKTFNFRKKRKEENVQNGIKKVLTKFLRFWDLHVLKHLVNGVGEIDPETGATLFECVKKMEPV